MTVKALVILILKTCTPYLLLCPTVGQRGKKIKTLQVHLPLER